MRIVGNEAMMLHRVFDIVFPAQCVVCRRTGCGLCDGCAPAQPSVDVAGESLLVRGLGEYDGAYRAAVRALKDGRRDVADALAHRLATLIPRSTTLVAVPTTGARRRVRGMDGVELIASKAAGICHGASLSVLRCVDGTQQRGRSRAERLSSRGRFMCRSSIIDGMSVALVDDVCTTGTTLEDCAAVLRSAGARVTQAFVVAVANRRA